MVGACPVTFLDLESGIEGCRVCLQRKSMCSRNNCGLINTCTERSVLIYISRSGAGV